jgi:hypothetical protein
MDFLTDRNKFTMSQAKQRYDDSRQIRLRVTSITWGHELAAKTHIVDDREVYENIYEMTLNEFITEWMEHFNCHHDEDIIDIEKI